MHIGADLQFNHDFYEWNNARRPRLRRARWSSAGRHRIAVPGVEQSVHVEHQCAVANRRSLLQELRQVGVDERDTEGRQLVPGQLAHDLGPDAQSRPPLGLLVQLVRPASGMCRRSATRSATSFNNLGPRLGFAYTTNDKKTVWRGGWGIYFIGPKDQWSHHTPANLSYVIWSASYDGSGQLLRRSLSGRIGQLQTRSCGGGSPVGAEFPDLPVGSEAALRCRRLHRQFRQQGSLQLSDLVRAAAAAGRINVVSG